MRSLVAFLEERYTEECLEPLKLRINSSGPAAGFANTDTSGDSTVAASLQAGAKLLREGDYLQLLPCLAHLAARYKMRHVFA
jgi:hypothetical protein